MGYKDKQHYVSQSYLRNFSPELLEYLQIKDSLDCIQKKKFKSKMKIYYFDIEQNTIGYRNISSLGRVNHYLLPAVDTIVRKTENKLNLLKEIIKNRSEDYLYRNNNQKTLWEIANCLKAKSLVFRDFVEFSHSLMVGDFIDSKNEKKGFLTYTKQSAEFFQTNLFTDDTEILFPLFLRSYNLKIPSDNVNGTFQQLAKDMGSKEEILTKFRDEHEFSKNTVIPNTVYPILIENKTDLPFITGDECVPKTGYVLPDLETIIPNYHFPINPDLAIKFLEKQELASNFPRKISDKYEVYKMNRLIYNCSKNHIFSNKEKPLRLTTIEPKERLNRYELIRRKYSRKEQT